MKRSRGEHERSVGGRNGGKHQPRLVPIDRKMDRREDEKEREKGEGGEEEEEYVKNEYERDLGSNQHRRAQASRPIPTDPRRNPSGSETPDLATYRLRLNMGR